MRVDGNWMLGPDGRLRPVVTGLVADARGVDHLIPLLVDTGADATVFTLAVLAQLTLDTPPEIMEI